MISEKKTANAMGGKTARACDGCLRKRARWYCAADDAFLCQACDASVHSANQLASRHERVRLEVASSKMHGMVSDKDTAPGWHQGFTRKARTPRPNKAMLLRQAKDAEKVLNSNESLVPEIGNEEGSLDETTEEELLYQVPVFDPFAVELGCDVIGSEGKVQTEAGNGKENMIVDDYGQDETCDFDDLHGFLPSDMDLAEFAADVESLLGGGALDEDACDVKELGLLDCNEEYDHTAVCFGDKVAVKIKDEEVEGVAAIDWNFDYESLVISEEEEKSVPQAGTAMMNTKYCKSEMKKNVLLKLNYDAVITAWASQGCPWTNGSRPEFNPSDCWPNCPGSCCKDVHYPYRGLLGCHMGSSDDGGREARVSRYREKRRTRLFSKKIRYEVRKLNAEKRPRMKGRFVKRTSFVGTNNAFPNYLNK